MAKIDSFKMLCRELCNDMYTRLNVLIEEINSLSLMKLITNESTARFS